MVRVSGPPPAGQLTLFSREIPLAAIGGLPESSIPTPGDAAGAIAIGAVDWRGNARKSYSSQGPTDDGRLKPDLVAPTDTRIMGPAGVRAIGGTSNAAPNAAGAAAVVLAAARRAGQAPSAAEVRQTLDAMALDLGAPGPDQVFGLGRIRVTTTPPRLVKPAPAALASVRGRVAVKFQALSRTRVSTWTLEVDGRPALRAGADVPARDHAGHPAAAGRLARPVGGGEGLPGKHGPAGLVGEGGQHEAGADRPVGEGAGAAAAPAAGGAGPAPADGPPRRGPGGPGVDGSPAGDDHRDAPGRPGGARRAWWGSRRGSSGRWSRRG